MKYAMLIIKTDDARIRVRFPDCPAWDFMCDNISEIPMKTKQIVGEWKSATKKQLPLPRDVTEIVNSEDAGGVFVGVLNLE